MQFVCIGDSITDANHFWSDEHPLLGDGYVYYLANALTMQNPAFTVLNKGYDGLTAQALSLRLNQGTITIPTCTYAILLIGINDIGVSMHTNVSLEEQHFLAAYDSIIQFLQIKAEHLICVSPFLFSRPAMYQCWIPELTYAIHGIQALCATYQIPFLPLYDYVKELETHYPVTALSQDGIHPTPLFSQLLAQYLLPFFL